MLSPFIGFVTGWMWVVSNIFTGATVWLGFAYYLTAVIPFLPAQVIASLLCLVFTGLNISGTKASSSLNNILVTIKLLVLLLFIVVATIQLNTANLQPFNPFGTGVIQGAYFIFFAFAGFARVAVVAEEVKDAKKNVPRAIILSLAISAFVYILVGFTAVGLAGATVLGNSNSPLAEAMLATGNIFVSRIVSFGALVATATVLLSSVWGVSRVLYSMARDNELPGAIGKAAPEV